MIALILIISILAIIQSLRVIGLRKRLDDAESAIKLIKEHQINQEIFLKTSLEDYGLN